MGTRGIVKANFFMYPVLVVVENSRILIKGRTKMDDTLPGCIGYFKFSDECVKCKSIALCIKIFFNK